MTLSYFADLFFRVSIAFAGGIAGLILLAMLQYSIFPGREPWDGKDSYITLTCVFVVMLAVKVLWG